MAEQEESSVPAMAAHSDQAADDQAFVDAISEFGGEDGE
jgi:hypothetical protein